MNTRIHSFKVYRIETVSGMKFWTFSKKGNYSEEHGDILLEECTLWDMLYKSKDGQKEPSGKSIVRKSDLEFLLSELAKVEGFEMISKLNA